MAILPMADAQPAYLITDAHYSRLTAHYSLLTTH